MSKSIYSAHYRAMLTLLRQERKKRGVMQTDLMKRLGLDQSSISRIETGDRRLDLIELRNYCIAIGIGFPAFARRLERVLTQGKETV
jgi:transcriptional regulator with XRE-family HTH domain